MNPVELPKTKMSKEYPKPTRAIAIIGSIRKSIMKFIIIMPFQLLYWWNLVREFNLPKLCQLIKNPITLRHIKSKFNFFLPIFGNRLSTSAWLIVRWLYKFSSINLFRFIVRTIWITLKSMHIRTMMLMTFLRLFTSAFYIQSSLMHLSNNKEVIAL